MDRPLDGDWRDGAVILAADIGLRGPAAFGKGERVEREAGRRVGDGLGVVFVAANFGINGRGACALGVAFVPDI